MPYCMHFFRGMLFMVVTWFQVIAQAMVVCEFFIEDARWLNEEFINLPEEGGLGTRVIVD